MAKHRRYAGSTPFMGGLLIRLSDHVNILEHMFDTLATIDPATAKSALMERIAELERIKSAAAAGQARAAAALDGARRAAEAGARGAPAARGRGGGSADAVWPARSRWRAGTHRCAAAGIWASPRPWCTRCRTRLRRWNAGRCRSG